MPPHCDSMDGPVVNAARQALDAGNVDLVLAYVPEGATEEVKRVFDKVIRARKAGSAAREIADVYFFETVVRLHREGEGAPYTGLKPAGLDVGPVIPTAEKAIAVGSPEGLIRMLTDTLQNEVRQRFAHVQRLAAHSGEDVAHAREYVGAMLGLEVYSHQLYLAMQAKPHEGQHEHRHG